MDYLLCDDDFYNTLSKVTELLIMNDETQKNIIWANTKIEDIQGIIQHSKKEEIEAEIRALTSHKRFISQLREFGVWKMEEKLKEFFINFLNKNIEKIIQTPAGWVEPKEEKTAVPER